MRGLKSGFGGTNPFMFKFCLLHISLRNDFGLAYDDKHFWIPIQIMDFNNDITTFILLSFCTLWLKLLLSGWTIINEVFLILTVHFSICGASNRNDRFDWRLDLWRNSIPGLPHLRHEDLVPQHRGSCCAAVGAPWAFAQWQGSEALWATHPQQNIPFAFHPNLGEQPLFLHEG